MHASETTTQANTSAKPACIQNTRIAATALATERIVVTADSRGFADLPGLEVRLVSGA